MQVPGAVLQGIGIGNPIDFSQWYRGEQLGMERRYQKQRLDFARQSRQNQTSQDFTKDFNPNQMKGDPTDAPIGAAMSGITGQANAMIQKGASVADINTTLGPQMAKVNQYMVNMKTLHNNMEDQLKSLPKDQGYDLDALRSGVKKSVFFNQDEKGNMALKDPYTVDPNQNFVGKFVNEHPELATNTSGIHKFFKELPKYDFSDDVTTTPGGKSKRVHVDAKMNYMEGYDRDVNPDGSLGGIKTDENGHPNKIVPQFSVATDQDKNGNMIAVRDPDTEKTDPKTGKTIPGSGDPMRILSTPIFNDLMQQNPHMADAFRGEANRHFAAIGTPLDDNDPKKKLYVQHLAYQEAVKNQSSTLHTTDNDKEYASTIKKEQENDPEYARNKAKISYAESAASTQARLDVQNNDMKTHPDNYNTGSGNPDNTKAPETVAQLFTNPKSVTDGAAIEKTPDGQDAYNITPMFSKGKINFKGGEGGSYTGAYYKADTHELLVYKKGDSKPETVNADNVGQFMSRIAESNGMPRGDVRGMLNKYGFGKGTFKAGKSSDLNAPIEQLASADKDKKIGAFVDTEKPESIKGMQTADGTVTDASSRNSFQTTIGMDKYSIDLMKGGKKTTKTFATKEEMSTYLKGGATATPDKPASNKSTSKKAILD